MAMRDPQGLSTKDSEIWSEKPHFNFHQGGISPKIIGISLALGC
jgi:hypothetical protein